MSDCFNTTEDELNFILGLGDDKSIDEVFDLEDVSLLQGGEHLTVRSGATTPVAPFCVEGEVRLLPFVAAGGDARPETTPVSSIGGQFSDPDEFGPSFSHVDQDAILSRIVSLSPTFGFDANDAGTGVSSSGGNHFRTITSDILEELNERLNLMPLVRGPPQPAVADMKVCKYEASLARRKRRHLRATSQVINMVGGGDVSEICRRAVADSANLDPLLLADFVRTFDAKLYANIIFEQGHQTMVETVDVREAAGIAVMTPKSRTRDDTEPCNTSSPIQPDLVPSNTSVISTSLKTKETGSQADRTPSQNPISRRGKRNAGTAFAAPQSQDETSAQKTLPSNKDPECRRQRRRMRNRLSAQASRDKREKAIEDAKQAKVEKDREIKALEKTLSEETQRMRLLEKLMCYARDYLGPDCYTKVVAKAGGHVDATVTQSS